MLDKFRQNFPTKSLVSEFLGINNGVYAVQCRIVGDGLTLNAIASGSTVEDAEDKARDRVLKLFFAGEPVSITAKRPSDELLADFKEAIAVEPPTPITEEQPPKKRSPKKKEPTPEPVETATETAIAEPKIVKPVLPEKEEISNAIAAEQSLNQSMIESGINPAIATPESDAQLIKEGLLIEDPLLELAIPQANYEPLDFEAVMSRTTNQLKRLGWTTEDGKNHLTETYGKKSRQLLTDEELIEFLNYLESQPDPS